MANEFTAITEDNKVISKMEVVVHEVSQIERTTTHTLESIDKELQNINKHLFAWNKKKVEFEALRDKVDVEASKVLLRFVEVGK